MSYELLSVRTLSSLTLDDDSCTLRGQLVNNDGDTVERTINLDRHISNINGELKWGGGAFSKTALEVKLEEGDKLTAKLQYADGSWSKTPSVLDLGECIYSIDGKFTYIPSYVTDPGCVTSTLGLQLDGNIDPGTFAVASDELHDRCRIAFKTSFDEKISLAEVAFNGQYWSLPTQIDVYEDKSPGQHIALTYHPNDRKTRSLFFSEEDGDGYIYQQIFNDSKHEWDEPKRLFANKKASDGLKAHRFTKYAATYYKPKDEKTSPRLLLYYVDESNYLQESVGKQDPGSKIWYWRSAGVVSTIPPKSFLAVTQRGERTYLIYRDDCWNLCLLVGSKRDQKSGAVNWHSIEPTVILKKGELLKDSPLAIAARCNGNMVTIFFVKRDGEQKIIYSIDHIPGAKIQFKPKRVGKLEPDSLIGAASFPNSVLHDTRQFSVSNLDGDNILVERIPKYYAQKQGGQQLQWVLSGGVIDTDVDYLGAGRVRKHKEDSSDSDSSDSD